MPHACTIHVINTCTVPFFTCYFFFIVASDCKVDSLRDNTYVTEQTLTLLSEHIEASKLPLLATQLGLPASVLEDALNDYKLPDTRALYVLRMWLGKEREEGGEGGGTVSELVRALELIGLYQLAHQ